MNKRNLLTVTIRSEREFPDVAAFLRRAVADGEQPREVRKHLLRRLWKLHYAWLPRCSAAKEIAGDWRAFVPTEATPAPGTKQEWFVRLRAVCPTPLSERQISTDLDATFR